MELFDLQYYTIFDFNDAIRYFGQFFVVRDEQDRLSVILAELEQQLTQFLFVLLVEAAGRFVGKNDVGIHHQGPCRRHALFLASRQFIGLVVHPFAQSQIRQQLFGDANTDRLMAVLFNDAQWVNENIQPQALMSNLFEVTTNMQSHDIDIDLYPLFTEDEIYDQWRRRNVRWYMDYGPAPQTGSVKQFSQRNLLRNIIETADTIRHTQATLRFGHEVCVMPLACLLELDSCGIQVSDLNHLDDVWRNYKIYPMACNIQLIFYAPKKKVKGMAKGQWSMVTGQDDVLVKALLNEREATLPIPTTQYPYYKWSDLRQYYLDKLARFDAAEAAWNAANPPTETTEEKE